MKSMILAVCFVFIAASSVFAQEGYGDHLQHGFFEPKTSLNLFGTAYNPATENWGWHVGAKTLLFHPMRSVWVGGVGFGIAFDQSKSKNRGPVFAVTFVPLEVKSFSLEVSLNRVESKDNQGNLTKNRLVVLAWNWGF